MKTLNPIRSFPVAALLFSLSACTMAELEAPQSKSSSPKTGAAQPIPGEVQNFATPLANELKRLVTSGLQQAEHSRTLLGSIPLQFNHHRGQTVAAEIRESLASSNSGLVEVLNQYVESAPELVPVQGKGKHEEIYWAQGRDSFVGTAEERTTAFNLSDPARLPIQVKVAPLEGHPIANEVVDVIFAGVGRLALAFRYLVETVDRANGHIQRSVGVRDWASFEFLGQKRQMGGEWPMLRIRGCAAALRCAAGPAVLSAPHKASVQTLLDLNVDDGSSARPPFIQIAGETREGGTDKSLVLTAALTSVREVYVVHPNWSPEGVRAFVRYHPRVEELHIERGSISGGVLPPQGFLPQGSGIELGRLPLKTLKVNNTKFAPGEFVQLALHLRVSRLSLNGTGLTDADAGAFATMPAPEELTFLSIYNNERLTDATARVVARTFPNLKNLQLYSWGERLNVTNAALGSFLKLKKLEDLSVSGTRVTPSGLLRYVTPQNFPNLKTLWADKLSTGLTAEQSETLRERYRDLGKKLNVNEVDF